MKETVIFPAVESGSLGYAAKALRHRGITVANTPGGDVTHLLLPVPCNIPMEPLLAQLPEDVTVIGGNLKGIQGIDLLTDERYLCKNAMITAQIAMTLAACRMEIVYQRCPVLVIGWGRIGKCLSNLLRSVGADVTVAARNPAHRAVAEALGFQALDINNLYHGLQRFRAIFNTVPATVLEEGQVQRCHPKCVKLELASVPGLEGEGVICARGLPGKYAPESSGNLIAETVIRLLTERRVEV